jgi:hypothetical protein
MNYLPFAGWWFYGAADALEMASYFSSWGLRDVSPVPTPGPNPATWVNPFLGMFP